jgi:hypothetical protein
MARVDFNSPLPDPPWQRSDPTANHEAARQLAYLGLSVFPAQPNKTPAPGLQWTAFSSCDLPQVDRWWQQHKGALPALNCGASGVFVLDLDRKPGAADGVDAFAKLCDENHDFDLMQRVPIVTTAGGGKHLFFAMPALPLGNGTGGLPAGIDCRGKGGYVIAQGARRPDGACYEPSGDETGLVEWLEAGHSLPSLPAWLEAVIRQGKKDRNEGLSSSQVDIHLTGAAQRAPASAGDRERAYAAKAIDDEAEAVASAPKGHRNETLNRAAFSLGQMVEAGWIGLPDVMARLKAVASTAGLPASEVSATLLSGIKAGRANPRAPLVDRPEYKPTPQRADGRNIFDADTGEVVEVVEGAASEGGAPSLLAAAPFVWTDPRAIPPRAWLYGKHYIRGFVSSTVAPGGVGKSALTMCEAMAIATGRDLLGVEPTESVPVWLLNLEDPMDELYRRAMAIALHYGLEERHLSGRLFLNSGRVTKLTIATTTKAGTTIVRPVVESLVSEVQRHGIGLIVIDPFVASHAVPENDNPAVNAVVTAWREIAERTGCAIELVHHTRKTLGGPITTQDGRGGNALEGGVRSMRALNRMTGDEAAKAGVENHRSFFRIDDADGKANMSPPSSKAAWYELRSIDLGNASADRPSDHVGVVTPWSWPDPLSDITPEHVRKVCAEIEGGSYRKDVQAADWAGHVVGAVIGVDTGRGIRGKDALTAEHRAARSKVSGLLSIWLKSGALRVDIGTDAKGNERPFIRAGEPCGE